MQTPSKLLTINGRDFARGLLVAVISAAIASLYGVLNNGVMLSTTELKTAGIAGITAGLGYILKNLFTDGNAIKREIVIEATEKGFVAPLSDEFKAITNDAPIWSETEVYGKGSRVTYDGIIWEAQRPLPAGSVHPTFARPENWQAALPL